MPKRILKVIFVPLALVGFKHCNMIPKCINTRSGPYKWLRLTYFKLLWATLHNIKYSLSTKKCKHFLQKSSTNLYVPTCTFSMYYTNDISLISQGCKCLPCTRAVNVLTWSLLRYIQRYLLPIIIVRTTKA